MGADNAGKLSWSIQKLSFSDIFYSIDSKNIIGGHSKIAF